MQTQKQAGKPATFVASFMETLEYGMDGASPVCKERVAISRSEVEWDTQKLFEVYLRRHFTLGEHSVNVRQLLLL